MITVSVTVDLDGDTTVIPVTADNVPGGPQPHRLVRALVRAAATAAEQWSAAAETAGYPARLVQLSACQDGDGSCGACGGC